MKENFSDGFEASQVTQLVQHHHEWQPIETAPKSVTNIPMDRQYVLVVYPGWKDGKLDPFVLMAYQDDLGWDTGSWRLHQRPTHWMPLPTPPSAATPAPEAHKVGLDAWPPSRDRGE